MSKAVLRAARVEDVAQLCAIEGMPEYRRCIGQWTAEVHRRNLEDADMQYTVAAVGEVVEGFVYLRGLASAHRSVEVARLAVRQPGRGLGGRLLRHALETAFAERGAHRVWLDVWDGNARALEMYRAFGFRVDGVFRESELVDGEYQSMLLLSMLDREYRAG